MRKVMMAEPYEFGQLHSFGRIQGMLMRQVDFPYEFRNDEEVWSADSDRIYSWDYNHACKVHEKYREKGGDQGLETWLTSAPVETLFAFVKELLKADPKIQWTGFRILGSVNLATGYTVWSYQLFAKKPDSKTKVYTGQNAPNVKGGKPRRMGPWGAYGYYEEERYDHF